MKLLELMSEEDRNRFLAGERDKNLWFQAHKLLEKPRKEIERHLSTLEPEEEADMRRRLNTVMQNKKKASD